MTWKPHARLEDPLQHVRRSIVRLIYSPLQMRQRSRRCWMSKEGRARI